MYFSSKEFRYALDEPFELEVHIGYILGAIHPRR